MKVSKVFLLCLLILISATTMYADNTDSIKLVKLEQSLRKEIKAREALRSKVKLQTDIMEKQAQCIDSLKNAIEQNTKNIKTTAEQLGVKIDETNASLGRKADSSDVKSKVIWGGGFLLLLVILGSIVYCLLHKRISKGNADVHALREKAEKINEDILNQFSLEMAEMQKISSSLDALSKTATNVGTAGDSDHSLIKALADRITFMEMTLYRMDSSIKGHKPLSKSIRQMKNNLLANGYELVEMLGKPYDEGMRVTANFIEDEKLEEGQKIITAVIRPQINYKGQMIQAANITVSQN